MMKHKNDDRSLTHFNAEGDVHMVDVGAKQATSRRAVAEGRITMLPETLAKIEAGDHRKGDVLAVARVAAIMAVKKTAELVPLCHPIMLTRIDVAMDIERQRNGVVCRVTTETTERTGVEMEALTGVQVALLTIYDMCKAVDRGMEMGDIRLLHKSGGKTGEWNRSD